MALQRKHKKNKFDFETIEREAVLHEYHWKNKTLYLHNSKCNLIIN